MGYTHYFTQTRNFTKTAWATIVEDVGAIIAYATTEAGIKLADGDGKPGTDPAYTDNDICLNGVGEEACETFYIDRIRTKSWSGGKLGAHFCKTARAPYDTVVTAILCYLSSVAGSHDVGSDGSGADFLAGLDLARNALPRYANQLDLPMGVMEDDRWMGPRGYSMTNRYWFRFCVDGRAYIGDNRTGETFAFRDHREAALFGEFNRHILSPTGYFDDKRRKALKIQQDKILSQKLESGRGDPERAIKPPAYVRPGAFTPPADHYYYADIVRDTEPSKDTPAAA
jgi:hypothetical protein